MPKLTFRFTSQLVRLESALGKYHVLPVPDDVAAAWKAAKVRRLVGTIDGQPVKRALQSHADGGSFLILGRPLLQDIGLTLKSIARCEIGPDPKPDELDLPEELLAALEQDEEARVRWESFTLGRRRSLASYVISARQEPTRIKRALELTYKIRTQTLYGDRKRASSAASRDRK